jgi:hypothetical protein
MTDLGTDAMSLIRRAKALDEPSDELCAEVALRVATRLQEEATDESPQTATLSQPMAFNEGVTQWRPRVRWFERKGHRALSWSLAALVLGVSAGAWGAFSQGALSLDWLQAKLTATAPAADGAPTEPPSVRRGGPATPNAEQPPNSKAGSLSGPGPNHDPTMQPKPELPSSAEPELPPRTAASPETPTSRSLQPADSLNLELEVIARARTALQHQDYATALSSSYDHATQFPTGQLLPEGQAIAAIAHCHLGHGAAGARTFLKRFPNSLFTQRVSRECGLLSNSGSNTTGGTTYPQNDPSEGSF